MNDIMYKILRNITINKDDIKNNKLTEKFFTRKDISEIKKIAIKKQIKIKRI